MIQISCFPPLSYSVLPEESTSFLATSFGVLPTDVSPVPLANQHQTNGVPLAVGLTLGLLALVVGVLCIVFYLYRRRGRTAIHLDVQPFFPNTVPPMRQTDQQSSLPQVGKHPRQPVRPSDAPMATHDPAMHSGTSGLGPPPSYEGPVYDQSMDRAQ